MIAMTLTPQKIYCSNFGSPVTTAFDYDDWPVDGCGVGQLCCPSTAPYKTRSDYDETNVSAVQIVCGVGTATLINAHGALFTLEQTEAQTVGGVNTAAVSDLQPAITVSAVTVTQPASSGLTTTPPPSSTSSGSAQHLRPRPVTRSGRGGDRVDCWGDMRGDCIGGVDILRTERTGETAREYEKEAGGEG
ncbi:hypothetical protein HO173_011517 [Letharia columbiana]|uniref:Uncharacterized protein n=1 Tax=Letharia columbiana TaxID=112416 RepID=A0A8H6FJ45_9LECA|nr:uncharacterized protein HO173_011517 [Letharia columbiana]KAF6229477.1 hypothetical protein HO173_011517 [Letharia columbiana]